MASVRIRRVYDPPQPGEGKLFLVDRLWPRGIRKEALADAEWLKAAGPSNELRHWFGHDPARWEEFRRRYRAELLAAPDAWRPIADAMRHGPVTLLYSAHDEEHNQAVVLRDFVETRASGTRRRLTRSA